jgi:hypothetical protein
VKYDAGELDKDNDPQLNKAIEVILSN